MQFTPDTAQRIPWIIRVISQSQFSRKSDRGTGQTGQPDTLLTTTQFNENKAFRGLKEEY